MCISHVIICLLINRAAAAALSTRTYCLFGWLQELQQEHWTGLLVVWSIRIRSPGCTRPDLLPAYSQAYVERAGFFSVCGDLTARKMNRLTKNLENQAFMKINYKHYTWARVYAKMKLNTCVLSVVLQCVLSLKMENELPEGRVFVKLFKMTVTVTEKSYFKFE